MPKLKIELLYGEDIDGKKTDGFRRKIYYASSVNKGNVANYIKNLDRKRRDILLARINKIAKTERILNEGLYKHLSKGVFEIKYKTSRIYCFEDGNSIVICTHGREKPSNKIVNEDIQKALDIKKQYFEKKKGG